MRNLALFAVLAFPVFCFAGGGDSQELIERIESNTGVVTIKHEVVSAEVDGKKFTMTFGTIVDESGVERKTKLARVYNCESSVFPTHITRNAHNPAPQAIDQYLIFEKESGSTGAVQSLQWSTSAGHASWTGNYLLYAFKIGNQNMTLLIGVNRPNDPQTMPGLVPTLQFLLYRCHYSLFPPIINHRMYEEPEPVTDQYIVLAKEYDLDDEEPSPNGDGEVPRQYKSAFFFMSKL